jgi:hypothetical protein
MKLKLSSLSILVFACVMVTGASADTITWNFATTPNADLGTNTETFTSGGIGIIATGSSDLYSKILGANETGLGLVGSSDHEISGSQSIMFDLSSLFSHNITSLTLMLGSIQSGETGQVCDVNNMCMTFTSSQNGQAVSIMTLYSDMLKSNKGTLTITAPTGDVLVEQLQATTSTVPEPSALLLLGTGLFMMAGTVLVLRKRLSAAA